MPDSRIENRPSALLSLPHELLVDILARIDPRDVSAMGRACSQLHHIVETSLSLWRSLYLNSWDLSPHDLKSQAPSASYNGKAQQQEMSMSFKDIVKQRRKARSDLRAGTQSLHKMLLRHTMTLPALIGAMRSRNSRCICKEDPNGDSPFSRTAATLASMFPHNTDGDLRWATFVYPREDVSLLQDWQHTVRQDGAGQAESKRRKARVTPTVDAGQVPLGSTNSTSSSSKPMERTRRRSSRIRRAKIPTDLWGFLEEGDPNDDLEFTLETVEFKEELAAELHCLHGVRRMDPPLVTDRQGRVRRRDYYEPQPKTRRRGLRSVYNAGHGHEDASRRYQSEEPLREVDLRVAEAPLQTLGCGLTDDEEANPDVHMVSQPNGADAAVLEQSDNAAGGEEVEEWHFDEDNTTDEEEAAQLDLCQWTGLGARDGVVGYRDLRSRAKEKVYDVGRYAYENGWGPLKPYRAGTRSFSRRNGMAEEGIPIGRRGPFTMEVDDSDEELTADGASSIGSGPGPDDPMVEVDADEVEDLRRDREAAGDASPADVGTAGAGNDQEGPTLIYLRESDADDEEDEDEGSETGFPFFDDRDREDRFAEMIWEVTAYSGSKVRNEVETIRGVEAGFKREYSGAHRYNAEGARQQSLSWQRERSIDWILLESIMVSVHCSLTNAITNSLWGRGFKLPFGARGDIPGVDGLGPLDGCVHSRQRRLIETPAGWHVSRGEEEGLSKFQSKSTSSVGLDAVLDDSGVVIEDSIEAIPQQQQSTTPLKPYDWARVESATWVGSYWFCDYPMFLRYNASLARDPGALQNGQSVMRLEEAIGDCLQLRLELNPMDRQEAKFEEGEDEAASNGSEDPEFPTLRFAGHTLTHHDEDPPQTRGRAHGYVRPIYSTDPSLSRFHTATGRQLPAIAGIHWKITHAYDGQDRWTLCGVQAGPPGTRAPIYGIWSDVEDEEASPVGPFCYMNVDSRPWKQVEELLRQQEIREEEERRRTTHNGDGGGGGGGDEVQAQ